MRYVSDSRKSKKEKGKNPALPKPTPSRAKHPVPPPIPEVSEREGVKVSISSAVRSAQVGAKPPKKSKEPRQPIDPEQISTIAIRVLICFAVVAAISGVMFLVYFFASQNSSLQDPIENFEGYPALVGGININEPPTSVASLSPLLTELTTTLPITNPLTSVSEHCSNPDGMPTIGTPLLPDIDKIIELDPEYLITLTPLTLRQKIELEQTGTKVLEFEMPTTVSGFSDLASELATLYLGKDEGAAVGSGIYGRFSDSLALYSTAVNNVTQDRPNFVLMLDISGFSATSDTIEAQIFSSILGQPAVTGESYGTTLEQVIDSDPEVLILPNTITMQDLAGTGLDTGTAAQNSNIYFIDMTNLEKYKPALLFDLARIANSVYPELELGD